MSYPPASFDLQISNQPDPPAPEVDDDLLSLAAQLTPDETNYLTALPPEAWQSEALWDDPVFQGIASKAQAHQAARQAPPPDPRVPTGGALDIVKALGLNDPTTWTHGEPQSLRPDANVRQGVPAPQGSMLWNTVLGLGTVPASASSAALGAMTERPGDLGHAASAAWADLQRMGPGVPAMTMGDEAAPAPTTPSGEAARHGVPFTPGQAAVTDFLLDPLNISNPLTDALHLGVAGVGLAKAGLAVAAKSGALAHAAVLLPNFAKAVKEAAERAPKFAKALETVGEALGARGVTKMPTALGVVKPKALEEIQALFPLRDAYGKPFADSSGATIVKRVAESDTLSKPARQALLKVAAQIGDRPVSAKELYALAQGEKFTPKRIVRVVEPIPAGEKQIAGAPLGIWNEAQEAELRDNYLRQMLLGVEGRDWYVDSGGLIHFYANEDDARAYLLAGDLATTSSGTEVSGNTGMGVKAYNQIMARRTGAVPGDPGFVVVHSGIYPNNMRPAIEAVHHPDLGDTTGNKRNPFQHNIARGGGFLPEIEAIARGVHDIWDGEAWKFTNADGTPWRKGFNQAQHDWMDRQYDMVLAEANRTALGGFNDWNEHRGQAAVWVGAKMEGEGVDAVQAGRSYADFLEGLEAQGSRETTPGKTTGHMPELLERGEQADQFRRLLFDIMQAEGGVYDAMGRDQIAAGYKMLVGKGFAGPGAFEGMVTPGWQTKALIGTEWAKDAAGKEIQRLPDIGSQRMMDATEATYGLLAGQDAWAWSKLVEAGSGVPRTSWDVALPTGKLTPKESATIDKALKKLGGKAKVSATPEGFRIGGPEVTQKQVDTIVAHLNGEIGKSRMEGWDVALPDGAILPGQTQALYDHIEQTLGVEARNNAVIVPIAGTVDGVRLSGLPEATMKQLVDSLSGTVKDKAVLGGGYGRNDWRVDRVGQQFHLPIEVIGTDKFDAFAPKLFERQRNVEQMFRKETNGRVTFQQIRDDLLAAVANEGWAGLEKLAKKTAVPVAVLAAGLAALQMPVQGRTTDGTN